MTKRQIQRLDQHLKQWRAEHPDAASLRTAFRQRLESFALNSMALEQEPVDPASDDSAKAGLFRCTARSGCG